MTHRVVVIDADRERTDALQRQLSDSISCTIVVVNDLESADRPLEARPDVVLISISAVDVSPETALQRIREQAPRATLLLSGAPDDTRRCVQLVRAGAYDYLTEESSTPSACASAIRQALNSRQQHSSSRWQSVVRHEETGKLVGTSEAMQEVFDRIGTATKMDMSVVVRGESGTGKELIARTIHAQSSRRNDALHVVDCTTVSERDLEDVLFGEHPRTTYADESAADCPADRTVVLDYVGKLSVSAQAMLNRSLKAQTLRQGAAAQTRNSEHPESARIIGLTRNDLRQAVRQDDFRKDLYFRLAKFPIHVPPLRERNGDVLQLARHFLDRHVAQCPTLDGATLTAEAKTILQSYCWPGNVRELLNVMGRAVHAAAPSSAHPEIDADDLMIEPEDAALTSLLARSAQPSSDTDRDQSSTREKATSGRFNPNGEASGPEKAPPPTVGVQERGVPLGTNECQILPLEELKRRAVERAYRICDGDVDHAAVELDIGRSTMYRMLKRYDIGDHG